MDKYRITVGFSGRTWVDEEDEVYTEVVEVETPHRTNFDKASFVVGVDDGLVRATWQADGRPVRQVIRPVTDLLYVEHELIASDG